MIRMLHYLRLILATRAMMVIVIMFRMRRYVMCHHINSQSDTDPDAGATLWTHRRGVKDKDGRDDTDDTKS